VRARLGLVRTFQSSSEFRRLTVLENLLVARRCQPGESFVTLLTGRRRWRREEEEAVEKARELLEGFGMAHMEDEYAGNLSGGQKRLVEIMRALMAEPTMLLLDEPMAGVNPSLARTVEGYLQELAAGGLTMLLVEHELDVVERMCALTIVMALGRVIASGQMAELRYDREVLDAYLAG
jgi:ABC-type branched-subunit amino acid transport system ATPase component